MDGPVGLDNYVGPAGALTFPGFVAIYVSLPFTTYTILAGLQAVPEDVLEAAHVDGANGPQRYWHIVLPLLRPGDRRIGQVVASVDGGATVAHVARHTLLLGCRSGAQNL